MINIKNATICKKVYISDKEFINSGFNPPNSRTMDHFTKKVLFTAYKLFEGDFSKIDAEKTGAVICTQTAAYSSIKKTADIIKTTGYKGINPSFFPNVMLSTALSHLTVYLNIHGPTCTFYDTDKNGKDGLDYCVVQLNALNACAMILICANENGWSEGKLIKRKGLV